MYQRRIYTEREMKLKEENRKLKDVVKRVKWDSRNKERKSELNKTWREDNAEYQRKYRKIKKLERLLKDYCFYEKI